MGETRGEAWCPSGFLWDAVLPGDMLFMPPGTHVIPMEPVDENVFASDGGAGCAGLGVNTLGNDCLFGVVKCTRIQTGCWSFFFLDSGKTFKRARDYFLIALRCCVGFCLPYVCSKLLQPCRNLCELMGYSAPGSSVHGDSPGKNTGVVCMPSSRGSS